MEKTFDFLEEKRKKELLEIMKKATGIASLVASTSPLAEQVIEQLIKLTAKV